MIRKEIQRLGRTAEQRPAGRAVPVALVLLALVVPVLKAGGRVAPALVAGVAVSASVPKVVKAQVARTATGLEVDCTSTTSRERSCVRWAASTKGLLAAGDILCTAAARTAGRCPDTIATDQWFPRRKAIDCTDQDLMASRGRCLYGRGAAVATSLSLAVCDASEWGHVALVEDEGVDYWCDGSTWQTPAPSPGTWRASMVQCGAGPTHDTWPDGGPLASVDLVSQLPTCAVDYNNARAWVGASDHDLPHADGSFYRCRDPGGGYAWEVSAVAYRGEVGSDANVNAVCLAWQNNGRTWNSSDPFWIPAPFEVAGETWLELQSSDALERWLELVIASATDQGKAHLEVQRNEPPD